MPRSGSRHLLFDSMNPDVAQYAVLEVNLSALSNVDGLVLDFWAKRIGSTIGRFCVDVSGDGTTWTEVFCERPDSAFKNYVLDLDKTLKDAGVALDADVFVRFRHFSLIQDFVVDDVRILRAAKFAAIQPVMGGIQLSALTETGKSYRVERTADFVTWTTVDTVVGNGGIVTILDAAATQVNSRFYRFVEFVPTN